MYKLTNSKGSFLIPLIVAGTLAGCGIKDLPNQVAPGSEFAIDEANNTADNSETSEDLVNSMDTEEAFGDQITSSNDAETIDDQITTPDGADTLDNSEENEAVSENENVEAQIDTENTDTSEAADDGDKTKSGNTLYDEYIDVINNYKNEDWEIKFDKFALIDLDGDEVPELFATGAYADEDYMGGMQPYLIVGHNEKGDVINDILADGVAGAGGYRGTLYYLPGLGKIHDSAVYAPFGSPSDTIYIMKDGKIDTLVSGYFEVDAGNLPEDIDDDFDILDYGQWYWDGVPVDEGEYKKHFVEVIENTHGTALCDIDYMGKNEILKVLEEKSNSQN